MSDNPPRCEERGDFLTKHPIICFLLGCMLIAVTDASCSVASYYETQAAHIAQQRQ